MSKSTTRILGKLSGLCKSIAAGHYEGVDELFAIAGETRVDADVTDLAEAFSFMVVQIEAREFRLSNTIEEFEEISRQLKVAKDQLAAENSTLKQEMVRLQIEIDHSRKEEEVAEITETDYFLDLQTRAKALRQRRNTGPIDP